ncbi:hypothetical protein AB0D11_02275 [Streptomyces monashensis]|uniref:zinc finger domain-containing protein n=1 Tax=Streptomyces monashensis TaxID=1678012 RepID=UPI0033DAC4E1
MTDHPEHAIRCPWCHATPGNRCTSPRGRRIPVASHDARIQAWTTRTDARDQKTGEPT